MTYGLGIDVGSAGITAAVSGGSGPARMVESAQRPALDLKRRLGDPAPVLLDGQAHSPVSLLAASVRRVVDTVEQQRPDQCARVVLTYPAAWGAFRRERFAEVPRLVDLGADATIVAEAEAAAACYAERGDVSDGDVLAVYDLGGGTFDATVVELTGLGPRVLGVSVGLDWIGGATFDRAVLAQADQELGGELSALDPADPSQALVLDRITRDCARAKEKLSSWANARVDVELGDRQVSVDLTRARFESMIRPSLEATVRALRRSMESAGVAPRDLAGVVLAGGSATIPLVRRMLEEDLHRPVLAAVRPAHCIAIGAATLAHRPPGSTVKARRGPLLDAETGLTPAAGIAGRRFEGPPAPPAVAGAAATGDVQASQPDTQRRGPRRAARALVTMPAAILLLVVIGNVALPVERPPGPSPVNTVVPAKQIPSTPTPAASP